MYKVGLTGGIGSGKSTVSELFRGYGIAVYDTDSRAKYLMSHSESLRAELVAHFGEECYTTFGELNRGWLASRVFSSKEQLERLNAIVHPAVIEDFLSWAEEQRGDYVVVESAILFESGIDHVVDRIVAVTAPEVLRLERAMERDGASREQIAGRMRNQMSDDERNRRADYTITNIEFETLKRDVAKLHNQLRNDSLAHNHR